MSSPPAVSVRAESLTHRYGRRATAIDSLAFAFEGPGVVAVTGANGSGKSTLLRILAGVLRPSAGRAVVTVGGRDLPPDGRRAALGLATPELAFYEEFTAHENLAFAGEARGLAAPATAADGALARVGLTARAHDRVAGFSSGMKQRLRLAFALLHAPPVLLLDEPMSHLDEAGRQVVHSLVRDGGRGGLVFIATNDPQEIQLAERRIELHGHALGDPS